MVRGFAAAVLFLAPFVPAQDDQRLETVLEFRRFFPKFETTAERVAALHTLEGMECLEAARELLKLLDGQEQEVRAAALAVLGTYRQAATFAELLAELSVLKDQARLAQSIEVVAAAGLAEALDPLLEVAVRRGTEAHVRYQTARALGRIGGPRAAEALRALLGDGDALVRVAAADAAGTLRLAVLAPDVVRLLADNVWQVQSAAIHALERLRPEEGVEPLISLLRKGGRLREEAAEALFQITALDFGVDPELWQRNWENLKSVGWRVPTDEELAKARQARQRSDVHYGKREETNSFAGIRTTSTRVLFVIDVSGSMDDRVVEVERFDAGYPDKRKFTVVKTELMRALESLSADTIFNVVAFASDVKPWKKQIVPANIVNKASAVSWAKHLQPIGGNEAVELAGAGLVGSANLAAGKTNTFAAVMFPFGIDPNDSPRGPITHGEAPIKNKIDTVFFLSDGRPSTGRVVDTREILAEVKRANEAFRIVFHTIAIGDFQKDFMRDLAQQNGGVFVDLGR